MRKGTSLAGAMLTAAGLCGGIFFSATSGAQDPRKAENSPQVLDELTVAGEHTGPGMWHVHGGPANNRGAGNLWILGSMSPLPKGITWRSKQLEQLLDHTDRVVIAKPIEIGIFRVVWLFITQRELLMVRGGKRLKDVMPPGLYARFAVLRTQYAGDSDKWERFRPLIATAFLGQAAFHKVGLSARLDLGAAVRKLAEKRGVRVEELKIAGVRDALDALKTMPPATENACVEASLVTIERDLPRLIERAQAWATGNVERIQALHQPPEVDSCRAALDEGTGPGEVIAQMRRTWLDSMDRYLRGEGVTVAVVNMDMLLEKGGLLEELREKGYDVEAR
ncbi:MAG: TraB/GumN family protein [Pseudomonadota bacterium]|nr:TraB/GumN family protein [Pseudomonadota bacterium]